MKKKQLLKRKWLLITLLLILCAAFAGQALAGQKTVTDQLGRKVVIPDKVERVVVLMHHALDIMLELGAQKQIVGVLKDWRENLSPEFANLWPEVVNMPTPGDLANSVNSEELLKLKPDVVIITHYMIEKTGKQIEALGIPVVAVSMYIADYEQASVLNPKLKNPEKAYTEGLKQGVQLLGEVLGKQEQAQKLLDHTFKNRKLVEDRVGKLTPQERITTYMAYPNLFTMGTGKYASLCMERAGGLNVAQEIDGYKQMNLESVLKWNPQVIFVQDRYASTADEIKKSSAWQAIDAVKNNKVYITPEYVKPWGHPCPESVALGELWMAKKLYPDKFRDIDMAKYVDAFYRTFYGVAYKGEH